MPHRSTKMFQDEQIMRLTQCHVSPSNRSCSISNGNKSAMCHESMMCIFDIEVANVTT
jgi:hypothetical protein